MTAAQGLPIDPHKKRFIEAAQWLENTTVNPPPNVPFDFSMRPTFHFLCVVMYPSVHHLQLQLSKQHLFMYRTGA